MSDPSATATTLLFDLDGTITDSFEGIAASFRHALDEVGHPEPDESLIAGIVGPPMVDTLASMGLDPLRADAAMEAYRLRYLEIGWKENAVYPGMGELLADLVTHNRRIALATSKNEKTATRILEHFDLAQHFTIIAGASDDGTRRAKADVIARALHALGIDAPSDDAHVVMIGDREHDVEGAAAFGIPTIWVQWGYANNDNLDAARWHAADVAELREILGV